jgi:response regulator of citrate/malate metabolism
METATQVAEVKACYEKMRAQIMKENGRALERIDRAEAAALKIFEHKAAVAPNGAAPKTRAPRGSRLDPEIQKAVLAVLAPTVSHTVNEIAKLSHASKSQVRATLEIAVKAGTAEGTTAKRNRKYISVQKEA